MDSEFAAPIPVEHPAPVARRERRRPGENRERLIIAATAEFALLGFRAASTASIGARAGVPQPHVYANFKSKRELYIASIERVLELMRGSDLAVSIGWPATEESVLSSSGIREGFLLQAVTAAADPEVGQVSCALVAQAQALLGPEEFSACLLAGVRYLLSESDDGRAFQ